MDDIGVLVGFYFLYLWLGFSFGTVGYGEILAVFGVTYFLLLLPIIPYLHAAKKLADAIPERRRKIKPRMVWLGLVPLLNIPWFFVIAYRLELGISSLFGDLELTRKKRTVLLLGSLTTLLYLCLVFSPLKTLALIGYVISLLLFLIVASAYVRWLRAQSLPNVP